MKSGYGEKEQGDIRSPQQKGILMFWVVNKKFAFLRIISWTESLWYAKHYYGYLKFGKEKDEEVRRVLTLVEAAELNKEQKLNKDDWGRYKKGDITTIFVNKERIEEIAKREYKEMFPGAIGLILGSAMYAQPQLILDGPEDYMEAVNALVAEMDAAGHWEGDVQRMDEIMLEWNDINKEMFGEEDEGN